MDPVWAPLAETTTFACRALYCITPLLSIITLEENPDFSIIKMQIDNTLGLSNAIFSKKEEAKLKNIGFTAKPK